MFNYVMPDPRRSEQVSNPGNFHSIPRTEQLPLRHAVSLVIRDEAGEFLVVKRPDDPDDDIAGVWGLPATRAQAGETELETASRVATTKLGITVAIGRRIGESTHARRTFQLHLVDYEARVTSGTPSVPQTDESGATQYVACKFTNDPSVLFEAAREGSQCTQIFLDDLSVDWTG